MGYECAKIEGRLYSLVLLVRKMHIDKPLFAFYENLWKRVFPDRYMKYTRHYYEDNKFKIDLILNRLSDEKSKKVYKAVIDYRTKRKPINLYDSEKDQYFPVDIVHLYSENFVDCGAYVGDTLQAFLDRTDNFVNYYAFEADNEIADEFEKKIRTLDCLDKIHLYRIGVSDHKGIFRFSTGTKDMDVDGHLSEDGDVQIPIDSLENILGDKSVSFIKMDIEGEETRAINGAWNIIKEKRPKLAICIYHSCRDVVDIPYRIISEYEECDFYIRHYSKNALETVFYAIPHN